ncbi:XisH family protein [Merismopedia glauca]|nr:XisH family protein [Merismopedia glauca]
MARDFLHQTVRIALERDAWIVTHDPLYLRVSDVDLMVDLAAERIVGAEKMGQKIAVEVKSFLGASAITELHNALGQTMVYRSALRRLHPERMLYLAISEDIYQEFFLNAFIQEVISDYQVKLLIVSHSRQEIALWKE